MLYLPTDPKPGEPIRADTITAILKYLRQITPRSSGTCNVQTGAGGSTFRPIFPGGLAGLVSNPNPRNLFVYDASTGGTPQISVTPGTVGGGVPTLNSNPINAQIGSPLAWPTLTLSSGDTLLWFELAYNSSNALTSVLINHGTTMPTPNIVLGTAGTDYYGLSSLYITTPGGRASVKAFNDFVSGNQGYAQCVTGSNCWLM